MQNIDQLTPAVSDMAKDWNVIRPLLGGTRAMREAATLFLPKWPAEDPMTYTTRLNAAVMFPAFHRTIQTLTGKPFSKPITIGDDVPVAIQEWCEDIDLQGRNISAFAAGIMETALGYGLGGILVECPQRPVDIVTKADEEAFGIRPYLVQVHPWQFIGWRAQYLPTKGWTLTQLRLMEDVEVEDGPYGVKIIQQVRLLEVGRWSTWRKVDQTTTNEWAMFQEGFNSLSYIPFVPTYGQRLGFMCAKPPLVELAQLNVKHWQSQSDQDTIVHVARVPILVATGIDDPLFDVEVGSSKCVRIDDPNGKLQYVEHTGQAITAGERALEELKNEMRQAGAELLVVGKRTEVTATPVASENELGTSALQRISQGTEDALDQALQMMADYAKLGDGGHVTIYDDFGVGSLSDLSAQLLLAMAQAGKLSDETLHNEMQRRNIINPDLTWEEEKALLEAQGPSLGSAGLDAFGNPVPTHPTQGAANPPAPKGALGYEGAAG